MGQNNWIPGRPVFGIKNLDKRLHTWIIGKSGTGKTTVLKTMLLTDLKAGEGCCLIDPHGDLAEAVLDYIPSWRINDVIYFNPADIDYPLAFNILETVPATDPRFQTEKILVASGLISVFKKIWADSWGPRMEHILRNAILALLEAPGTTLLGLPRLFTDADFRQKILHHVQDPVVRGFWVNEYPEYTRNFRTEAISPILNKVGAFLSSQVIRNIVSQPKSTFDFRDVMNNRKILIMNLSKGRIGEDNAALLGAMMVTKLHLAAMDRARMPEEERKDFWCYVDEWQNFATDSFAEILSESRKYRMGLVCANQFMDQLPERTRYAVLGTVGTLVSFRVGPQDANLLEQEFWPQFKKNELVNFPNYRAAIKMMEDGAPQSPFSMTTALLKQQSLFEGHREKIIRVSRERNARERVRVEEKINRWIGVVPTPLLS